MTLREGGILGISGKAAGIDPGAGHIPRGRTVGKGGGAGGMAREAARVKGLGRSGNGHLGRRGAGVIGIRHIGKAHEAAHIAAQGGDGGGGVHITVMEVGAGIVGLAHEAADIVHGGLVGLDGAAFHLTPHKRNGLVGVADKAARVQRRTGRCLVLVERHAVHLTVGEDDRDLVLVHAGDIGLGGEATQIAGAVHRGIDHLAIRNGALAPRLTGKTGGEVGAGHGAVRHRNPAAGSHTGIIVGGGAQEAGHHAAFGGGVDGGAAEGHIMDVAIQHAGKTGIRGSRTLEPGDGEPGAVEIDSLVKGPRRVEGHPVGDGGSIDVLEQTEVLGLSAHQHAAVMHIVQLPGIRNEIGVFGRTVPARKRLLGQRHMQEGVQAALLDNLVPAHRERGRIDLVIGVGHIDGDLGAVRQGDILPGKHHIGREHVLLGRYVHILQRQGIVLVPQPEAQFLQRAGTGRQGGLELDGGAQFEASAMGLGPVCLKFHVFITVHAGKKGPVGQMRRASVGRLGRTGTIGLGLLHARIRAGAEDGEGRTGEGLAGELGLMVGDELGDGEYLRLVAADDTDAVRALPGQAKVVLIRGESHLAQRLVGHAHADGNLAAFRGRIVAGRVLLDTGESQQDKRGCQETDLSHRPKTSNCSGVPPRAGAPKMGLSS